MAEQPSFYWDACAWIGLINRELNRFDSLLYVIERAQRAEVILWTSTFTLAEVFKKRCAGITDGIDADQDKNFEDFILQDFVRLVQVDTDVGVAARRLLRRFPDLKKPQDAIHAATAALSNVDELHTFDGCDLLLLNGKIPKPDGGFLRICKPPLRPDPNEGTLFAERDKSSTDEKGAKGGA